MNNMALDKLEEKHLAENIIDYQLSEEILEIKETLNELKLYSLDLKKHEVKLNDLYENIKNEFEKISLQYNKLTYARQKYNEEREKALKVHALSNLAGILKKLLKPSIGSLHHHGPRQLSIPKYYNKNNHLKNPISISIVTPSFNHGEFLERTIKSVLNQNYPKLEYVIQDGGSTDASVEIIKQYQDQLKHWHSANDNGQSHALNLGFQHASGEIMAYLNSDDILLPGSLNYVANFFNNNPTVDVVYSHRILIDEFDREIGRWVLPPDDQNVLCWADFIPQETLFWRKRIWKKAGGKIDENFQFAMDWDLLLRFKKANATFVRLPRFLAAFRIHSLQKTSEQINDIGFKEMDYLRKQYHGRDVSYFEIKKNISRYMLKHIIWQRLYRMGIFRF